MKDFNDLKDASMVFSRDAKFYYYIFTISGVTEDMKDLAEKNEVRIVSLDDMYS